MSESMTPITEVKVIEPVEIDGSKIAFSSVDPVSHPEWSAVEACVVGDLRQVSGDRLIYRALTNSTGKVPSANPTDWKPIGPMNYWAMFDLTLNTKTVDATRIVVKLRPGAPISGLYVGRVTAGRVLVEVNSTITGENLETREVVVSDAYIDDWFEHFYGPLDSTGDVLMLDLPQENDAEITVTFDGLDEVSVGALVVGQVFRLGAPQYGLGARRITYSKFTTDDEGITTVDRRPTVRRSDVTMFFDSKRLNKIMALLERLDGVTCVWVPVPEVGYESLAVLGWHRDVIASVATEGMHRCQMYFQGAP